MNIVTLLPFIVLIGAMFLMTRSAKNKQRQAAQMRDQMQPGTGVRTIGGMYATVKEVNDDTVLLEVAPGVHAIYAKNAIGAVLEDAEYNRIVHGIEPHDSETPVVPDDASSLTEGEAPAAGKKIDLGKGEAAEAERAAEPESADKDRGAEPQAKDAKDAKGAERDGKDGDTEAK
ncbi:preprotein translocase subunit YajC [Streptosporangium nondiastaticum]|uniref:Preprotein translocase subunit YajC n=1 Tax=Streptosporangium nondiastaticum TaxID=35764 RepID=A0A9X7JRJ8_9ACTN|nr:preprotein translocase subunit YajC [Streptosporangium nondiastaticum]PSJ28609.1 preprotein translocase subunit YajC [Streptosporangium nondiastaticum]